MPPVGFEPTISAGELPQTYALDRAATGTGDVTCNSENISVSVRNNSNMGFNVKLQHTPKAMK